MIKRIITGPLCKKITMLIPDIKHPTFRWEIEKDDEKWLVVWRNGNQGFVKAHARTRAGAIEIAECIEKHRP